jgi:hypothetical protein
MVAFTAGTKTYGSLFRVCGNREVKVDKESKLQIFEEGLMKCPKIARRIEKDEREGEGNEVRKKRATFNRC